MNIKPPRLNPGDRIGIIAPAGPVTESEIQPGIDLLITKGYNVVQTPYLYQKQGYLAGSDEVRLEDLHSMFRDKDTKAIFCARGGYGTLRLLDKIDYDLIRKNPKIVMGYSDITALLLAIHKNTGMVTFHGPVVKEIIGDRFENMNSFFDLVSSQDSFTLDMSGGEIISPGQAKGALLGGNLSLISHLIGTHFMPSMKGAILFIEERGEPLYRIDRMLTHLRLSGVLNVLEGLIVGTFVDCGDTSEINRLFKDIASRHDIPVIGGLPVGHGAENIAIPMGLKVELDTDSMTLSANETCVAA